MPLTASLIITVCCKRHFFVSDNPLTQYGYFFDKYYRKAAKSKDTHHDYRDRNHCISDHHAVYSSSVQDIAEKCMDQIDSERITSQPTYDLFLFLAPMYFGHMIFEK